MSTRSRKEIPFPGPQAGRGSEGTAGDPPLRLSSEPQGGAPPGGRPRPSGMDVPRAPRRRVPRLLLLLLVVLALAAITLLVGRLGPAAPVVERDLLVLSEVERGGLDLVVRGWGELAADQLQRIEATVSGRVAAVNVEPGATVRAGMVLVELASPELELEAAKAEQEYTAARAGFLALRRSLGTQRLERQASLADLRSALQASRAVLKDVERRATRGESVELEAVGARDAIRSLEERISAQEKVLALLDSTGVAQVELEKQRLVDLAEVVAREKARLAALRVEAPVDAVVEQVDATVGEWVTPGAPLLRLLRPERMFADLRIPSFSARKVERGADVLLVVATGDTLAGTVGNVAPPPPEPEGPRGREPREARVEVRLSVAPRIAAAADAGVDGTIRIGWLEDALSVQRPAWAVEGTKGSLFRVAPDGRTAERVKVRFGLGSSDRIQVLEGLEEGDVVIVSDMSRFDGEPCVRLRP